ncbi:unnamed protein product [Orchesella dallaii]|uniref:F-box domain-containing protein n=1 Tax=Orchesella dallaii TaxID=48710 RepID=A0ABP1RUL3_9HEXA
MDATGSPPQKKLKSVDNDATKITTSEDAAMKNSTSFKSPITSPMLVPELWDLIFRNVVTDDYLRVINSCPEWNQLLNSRKITELFPMALPFIMKFLPKNDFLNLRLVSRDWKRKCEIIYENHPARLATATSDLRFPKLSSSGRMSPSFDDGVKFQGVESFQRFNSEVRNDCGNPFPGRCVWLLIKELEGHNSDDNDSEEEEEVRNPQIELDYWNAINQLLLQFGEHIWYLQLDYLFRDVSFVETRLRNMLLQVPNLKRLRLSFGGPEVDFDDSDEFNLRSVEFFKQNPPPKLENLEVFSCTNPNFPVYDEFQDFSNQLVKSYCPTDNLKRLNLPDMSYKPTPLPNLLELRTMINYLELPALKEASPKLESFGVSLQFEDGVVDANEYQGNRWRILNDGDDDIIIEDDDSVDNNIGVVFPHWNDCDDDDEHNCNDDSDTDNDKDYDDSDSGDKNIGVVFTGLHIFADTLKELDLLSDPWTLNWRKNNFKVVLPKLEKLCIPYSLPINHLLELKSLKYLKMDESPIFRDKTYCSNIFEQLPKLEKVVHTYGKERRVLTRPV